MISTIGIETYCRYQYKRNTNKDKCKTNQLHLLIPLKYHNDNHTSLSTASSKKLLIPTTKYEALQVLWLNNLATSREISLQFKILALRYHSNKWDKSKPFSKDEATEKFKVTSNAKELLLNWNVWQCTKRILKQFINLYLHILSDYPKQVG